MTYSVYIEETKSHLIRSFKDHILARQCALKFVPHHIKVGPLTYHDGEAIVYQDPDTDYKVMIRMKYDGEGQ